MVGQRVDRGELECSAAPRRGWASSTAACMPASDHQWQAAPACMPHLIPLAHGTEEVVHKRPLEHVHVYYAPLQARQVPREHEEALGHAAQAAKLQETHAIPCRYAFHATPCLTKSPSFPSPSRTSISTGMM